jgi:SAM-dependent methyltransferase
VGDPTFYLSDLNTSTYDLGIGQGFRVGGDDIAFFRGLTATHGGRVLELGCGTGRVALSLASDGCEVTGLDRSPGMIAEARRKLAGLDWATAARVRLVEGDMAEFDLDGVFDVVIIPARAFAFLLTPDAQRGCLARIAAHLRPGGMLAIDLFDPRLDLCAPDAAPAHRDDTGAMPNGNTLRVQVLDRHNDSVAQVLRETWRFTETDPAGAVLREVDEELVLRWTFRYEMRHLLELAGFIEITEASDFAGSPPAYGLEQVWTCVRP